MLLNRALMHLNIKKSNFKLVYVLGFWLNERPY